MFKDFDKYLSTSLKVYMFLLICTFILKVVGLDYFGLDLNNKIVNTIASLVKNNLLANNAVYMIPLIVNHFVIFTITTNDNSKKAIIFNLLLMPLFYLFEALKIKLFGSFAILVEFAYFLVIAIIYKGYINKDLVKRFLFIITTMTLVQIISIITRTTYSVEYISNPVYNIILNFDFVLMLIIIYKLWFMKGDENVCGYLVVQFSSLQKRINFSALRKKLQKCLSNFSYLRREEKATYIIYFLLSFIWNSFTLAMIILIAMLNDTFVECVYIVTSFWLTKRIFGKPFHLKSMMQCFILSNATYYILNRITTPLGISMIVPIMLGVGLSYVTSKLVKKAKPLYKGMPEDLFNESILKVADKNSLKYSICYDFFIKRKSAISLALKYNYSEVGIRKITERVNKKIREL